MKKYWPVAAIVACLSAWGTIVPLSIASANMAIPTEAIDRLSLDEQTALENGDIVITGTEGDYVARMVVDASVEDLWSVLTDYNNFTEFLPNIISSKVVESTGNNYVVEQVSKQRVFLFDIESRLLTENIQTEKQRIDFRLIEGDLSLFQGSWTIEPISPAIAGNPDRLLITQSVEVQPERGTPEDMFYDLFQSALEKTLTAIREEVDRRKSL